MRAYNRCRKNKYKAKTKQKDILITLENWEMFSVPMRYVPKVVIKKGKLKTLLVTKKYFDVIHEHYHFEKTDVRYMKDRFKNTKDITCVTIGKKKYYVNYIETSLYQLGADNVLQKTLNDYKTVVFLWDTNSQNKWLSYNKININEKYRGKVTGYVIIKYFK